MPALLAAITAVFLVLLTILSNHQWSRVPSVLHRVQLAGMVIPAVFVCSVMALAPHERVQEMVNVLNVQKVCRAPTVIPHRQNETAPTHKIQLRPRSLLALINQRKAMRLPLM